MDKEELDKGLDMAAEAIASRALNAAPTEANLKKFTKQIKQYHLLKKYKNKKGAYDLNR